ncbi:NAD-glutamate dehydrogenase [soil metagenome]
MDGADAFPASPQEVEKSFRAALDGAPFGSGVDSGASAFLNQVGGDLLSDETPALSLADLGAVAAGFWRFGQEQVDSSPRGRLQRAVGSDGAPLNLDVLEIAQPDAPFLVDSVMGELADAGLEVRGMAHPVVTRSAGRKVSMILALLSPVGEDRRAALLDGINTTLSDVHAAVRDYTAMRELMRDVIAELAAAPRGQGEAGEENLAFLRWLKGDRFVFLGARRYDYPRTPGGDYAPEEPRYRAEESFGVLRDQGRAVLRRASEPAMLTTRLAGYLDSADPLVVAKSNLRSRVHRRVYMDYVGVKRYAADGKAIGETRFVGLFTAEAYDEPVREIPLIRAKTAAVLARAGATPSTHSAKRLKNIVEGYPRDELFQMTADELFGVAMGLLHLSDRPRVRIFARTDPFDRFVSVLLFTPRDRYDSGVRERAGAILAKAWNGRVSAYYPSFSEGPLAQVHFIIGVEPGAHARPDLKVLEAQVEEAVRTWRDRFEGAVRQGGVAEGSVAQTFARWTSDAYPAGYRDRNDAAETLEDIRTIEGLTANGEVRVRAFRDARCTPLQFRFKLYRAQDAVRLSDTIPILENMGLKALEEEAYALTPADGPAVWVHEFLLEDEHGERLSFDDIKAPFEAAFDAVWSGRAENDGFNRLVLELGVGWRDAAIIRALARYRAQSGLDPSPAVQEQALRDNPVVSRLILELFRTRFDTAVSATLAERKAQGDKVFAQIIEALEDVASLDADRVLRRIALLVQSTLRTNYYQTGPDGSHAAHISFKIASSQLEDLPAPKPFREIYVSSPAVEGVHLRFGPVARGGLRWSDRRDDFRTEVLGLVKAQQVKNAVIVPVGSKGGFFPKLLPRNGTPDQTRAEAVKAYKTFLSGLLDPTDNLDAKGAVIHPRGVVIHDGDDPYLVVAADKGTATFSDIANGVAADYGFWLGDAFASGGSVGYDHKVMGITARGAWEAVKRHFREIGKDIQSEPFTMAGVGDMSGDVFGNGALLSKETLLVAAFDHRHIFLDPAPEVAASWVERKRLFDLPRSSWEDYDKALISDGGGVYPRTAKSIAITPQVRAMLDLSEDELAPVDLIRAILKMRVELLYLGGIGTYVKAAAESNTQVGDKANDAVRIDGPELRCKVVGEGANLGFTQAGRIAFARNGGRINTDAIDNSAGVDTSDHEVNIKILLGQAIADQALKADERVPLLASMTEEVGEKVLAHNYAQTLTLSLQEASAPAELDAQIRFMKELEAAGRLDRKVEGLPGPGALAELAAADRGLTRPELAVLTAYGKLELSAEIVASDAPDDPWFEGVLKGYFPKALEPFGAQMAGHRLRREIIATVLANGVVDWVGPTFASRLRNATGADAGKLVTAFEAARQVFRLPDVWSAVSAADGAVPAVGQTALYLEIAATARAHAYWLARRLMQEALDDPPRVQALIDSYQPAVDALQALGAAPLSAFDAAALKERCDRFVEAGATPELAARVAALRPMTAAVEIADLAFETHWPVEACAFVFHQTGAAFGYDRLRAAAASLPASDPFERAALRSLVAEMVGEQLALARVVIAHAETPTEDAASAVSAIAAWAAPRKAALDRANATVAEVEASGPWSFAKLTIANTALRGATGG